MVDKVYNLTKKELRCEMAGKVYLTHHVPHPYGINFGKVHCIMTFPKDSVIRRILKLKEGDVVNIHVVKKLARKEREE